MDDRGPACTARPLWAKRSSEISSVEITQRVGMSPRSLRTWLGTAAQTSFSHPCSKVYHHVLSKFWMSVESVNYVIPSRLASAFGTAGADG